MANRVSTRRTKSRAFRRQEAVAYIAWHKEANGCARCDERRPNCLDYHHTDPRTKTTEVSKLVSQEIPPHIILDEIAKCILLCANCHRVEEWGEGFDKVPMSMPESFSGTNILDIDEEPESREYEFSEDEESQLV